MPAFRTSPLTQTLPLGQFRCMSATVILHLGKQKEGMGAYWLRSVDSFDERSRVAAMPLPHNR